jgi:hypothetical protein
MNVIKKLEKPYKKGIACILTNRKLSLPEDCDGSESVKEKKNTLTNH